MHSEPLELVGLKRLVPDVRRDSRGFFIETYNEGRYHEAGIACAFVQDNHSSSRRGTIRGMHYQQAPGQAKRVRVALGRIFDVAVDIRPDSPTFGRWQGVYLDAEEHAQLFVPVGFAHGFCVVSERAEVLYKTSSVYDHANECGFAYNDPAVGIDWPVAPGDAEISARDAGAPTLQAIRASLPRVAP